jgi:RNA polymerase sigma-70 factor (ECF subfamily)
VNSDCDNHEEPADSDWDQWVRQHARAFLLYARQQARAEADAEDLVQEAMIECWKTQAEGSLPSRRFVFTTIRRRAIDLARSRERRAGREATAQATAPPCWFDESPEERERVRRIEGILRGLPQIYREVVTLKVWGELTFEEIAGTLGIPANTAASRYRYGLAELRRLSREVFT